MTGSYEPLASSPIFNQPKVHPRSTSSLSVIVLRTVIYLFALVGLVSLMAVCKTIYVDSSVDIHQVLAGGINAALGPAGEAHKQQLATENSTTASAVALSSEERANATILILVSPATKIAVELLPSLQSIEESFNRRLGYPIQLLIDGKLPPKSLQDETSRITGGKAKWWLLDHTNGWGKPDWISDEDIAESRKKVGFSAGYRNMCRFYSGFFWKHPATMAYDYIFRLDEGIKFWCPIDYDPFMLMKHTKTKYAYSIINNEGPKVATGLFDHTKQFFANRPQFLAADNNIKLFSGDGGKTWDYKIVYNNFEISHRSLWESPAYTAYFNFLDKLGGIYHHRWGDAPIHTLFLAHALPRREWLDLSASTGYQHGRFGFHCPALPQWEWEEGVGYREARSSTDAK
ncbi:nucleotide-diphospho-sugar transferase [Meredithblackwellia eburnea MCA 4105]